MKSIVKSKRFWTGVVALITGISFLFTGEKSADQVIPELVMTVIGIVQTIIAITSKAEISVGGKSLAK